MNADQTQQFAVEQLLLAAHHGNADAVDFQAGARAQPHRQAGHHRPFERAHAVAHRQHLEAAAHRSVAGLAGEGGHRGAQGQFEFGSDAGFQRSAACRRIEHQAQRHLAGKTFPRALREQRMQHAGGVAVATGAGVVLRIGNDHRLGGRVGQAQRLRHRVARRMNFQLPLAGLADARIKPLHRAFGQRPMAPHHRRALFEVRRRKAHAETQHRAVFAVERDEFVVQALGRFEPGALRVERNQERQPPRVHGLALPGLEAARQQFGGPRPGVGHVDMRIGAVCHQRIGLAQHAQRDVGVQVQAGNDRQRRPDDGTQARQQLTLAVVGAFGHRGAMQVEVDRIEPAAARRAHVVADRTGNVLERVARHVRRRNRTGPARRQQRPAAALRGVDEACDRNVDAGE